MELETGNGCQNREMVTKQSPGDLAAQLQAGLLCNPYCMLFSGTGSRNKASDFFQVQATVHTKQKKKKNCAESSTHVAS